MVQSRNKLEAALVGTERGAGPCPLLCRWSYLLPFSAQAQGILETVPAEDDPGVPFLDEA